MNLAQKPSKEELTALLSVVNDAVATHVIWVSHSGLVSISILPEHMTPIELEEATPSMKFRLESLACGNGYTGIAAAQDESWVNRLFDSLTKAWAANATGYIYE